MFSIAPYRVSVIHNGGQTVPLWNPAGNQGLPIWFHNTLQNLLGNVIEVSPLSRSRVHSVRRNADSSVICGIFQTGENGFTSELVDTGTGAVNHNRLTSEAEFIPFFFMLAAPQGGDFGILALQKFKNMGIRDTLATPLITKFDAEHPGRRLRINRLVPAALAHQLLNEASIKSIRLVSYPNADDSTTTLGKGYHEKTHSIEMVFRPHRQGSFPVGNLVSVLSGNRPASQLFEVNGFDYEKIKVELEINGKRRVLDLGRPDVITPNVDVTDDLKIDQISGHPTTDSLIEIFGKFAQDTLTQDGNGAVLDLNMTNLVEATPMPLAEGVEAHAV